MIIYSDLSVFLLSGISNLSVRKHEENPVGFSRIVFMDSSLISVLTYNAVDQFVCGDGLRLSYRARFASRFG